jgi:hypothetical protein
MKRRVTAPVTAMAALFHDVATIPSLVNVPARSTTSW